MSHAFFGQSHSAAVRARVTTLVALGALLAASCGGGGSENDDSDGDGDGSSGDGDGDSSSGDGDGDATGSGGDPSSGGTIGDGDAATGGEASATGGTMTGTGGDVSGTGGDTGDCTTPPPASPLLGWASEAGGTTGGGSATPTVISDANAFSSALAGNTPRVIYVDGVLSTNSQFEVGSNITIVGICGAELHGSLGIDGVSNVIMRNLKVVGHDCDDSPGDCSGGEDAIEVRNSHHLWFDHLDVSDGSDGNLDMTAASDYITISWTKFSYSTARADAEQGPSGHRFSNLIGGSDSDTGDYRITFHHNWWADNVDQRMPRTRFGDVHVFNNLYTSSGNSYCTNAGIDSRVLVQNNIYRGVNNPLSPDDNGDMREEGNLFIDTSGNTDDDGGSGFTPPYQFTLDATAALEDTLRNQVGPQM